MPGTLHYYFRDSIGVGDWFTYGTTLEDIRYAVEGQAAFAGELAADTALPDAVVFHYPKCYGGDVWEGYGIYNYTRSLAARGVKTTAHVEGLCASIATLTALGADEVLMADAAIWMVHKPMADAGPGANADDHAAAVTVLNKIQDQLVGRYVARSGGKLDAATAHALVNGESYLDADQCLAYGFITGKLEDAPLVAPTEAAKVLNYLSPTALKHARMSTPATPAAYGIAEFFNDARAFFGSPKNEALAEVPVTQPAAVATKTDVTGGDPIYSDGELTAGSAVYSDEPMTIAYPDGEYTLADGRSATVLAGSVDEMEDADTAATADLQAENDALKAEVEALKTTNALTERKLTAATNKLKAAVPGSGGNPTPPGAAQNVAPKAGQSDEPAPARAAERALIASIK